MPQIFALNNFVKKLENRLIDARNELERKLNFKQINEFKSIYDEFKISLPELNLRVKDINHKRAIEPNSIKGNKVEVQYTNIVKSHIPLIGKMSNIKKTIPVIEYKPTNSNFDINIEVVFKENRIDFSFYEKDSEKFELKTEKYRNIIMHEYGELSLQIEKFNGVLENKLKEAFEEYKKQAVIK
ncbi:hypothetical protein V9L05_20925 [Bernardetia sp. Wsw4-3y2]|uniref:hypothetical protein n=1 Tax=Bernardetia sp. Wsw4-3y2 TaxID=3127471 RepID=UPI0030CC6C1A